LRGIARGEAMNFSDVDDFHAKTGLHGLAAADYLISELKQLKKKVEKSN
jgi:hypothetical protein